MNRAAAPATRPVRERAFGAAAVRTSLAVGTALTLINHPGVLRSGLDPDLLVPLLLNYIVPFLVAGYSRHRLLERLRSGRDDLEEAAHSFPHRRPGRSG